MRPLEPEKLTEGIPRRVRVGVPVTIEVRAPRARLEAWSGGGPQQIITKAMAMRLKAPDAGFTIEVASPETQWSEGAGPLMDDVVSWRWIVTAKKSGQHNLQLNASTRIVGRDAVAAERALPDQIVEVRVTPNYAHLAGQVFIWLTIACVSYAIGQFGERLVTIVRAVLASGGQ